MASLEDHQSANTVKLLLVGVSGSGKTGSLAALAAAGYRLFIADFDNGLDILKDPKILNPMFRKNVFYETFYDKHAIVSGQVMQTAEAMKKFSAALGKWPDPKGEGLGNLYSWGDNDVFVVDSLTFLGEACMRETLSLTGHLGQRPSQPEWGTAIDKQESVIEMLYNPAVKCNVIVTSHMRSGKATELGGVGKLFPSALGAQLPQKIGRYFNNIVQVVKTGSGDKVQRKFITTATQDMDLKTSKPSTITAEMEPDLAKLFKALKGT